MSIVIPFDLDNFASVMKEKISGVDLILEPQNIQSSLSKVAVDCMDILSADVYKAICDGTIVTDNTELQATLKDYLQRSMLHFSIYEHLIFLMVRIKNDGVTVQKSDRETTIYKYMQDGLDNKLISLGWFWMNRLIAELESNKANLPLWNDSDIAKDLTALPVGLIDFRRWVGVSDQYFLVVVRWLIQEVWTDNVLSRIKTPEKSDTISRAVCYEVMGRACRIIAFQQLPEPIRVNISNEMSKSNQDKEETSIRERVSEIFLSKANAYWLSMDVDLNKQAIAENPSVRPIYTTPRISEDESFAY